MPTDERTADHRRINKPIMEKRRRARINDSLTQLKSLVLEGMKKDPARHSKLEKADILEMAVKHLKLLQSRPDGSATRYREGYSQCRRQVAAFLGREVALDSALRQRLLAHLSVSLSAAEPEPELSAGLGGLQLVPTSLPGGQLALIVPSPAGGTAATTLPLTVAVHHHHHHQHQQQQQPAAVRPSSASPAPSSPARPESGYDEPHSPCSPAPSVGSSAEAADRADSPQPLDLVAHNRTPEDACWRPW